MSELRRLTISLTSELASEVQNAVRTGDYASSSEVIREALRDWRRKRVAENTTQTELREFIAEGLKDIEEGRVKEFDAEEIKRLGRERFAKRGLSA